MAKIDRDDIYLISRHSDLTKSEIHKLLEQHVYNNALSWKKFLRIFFISMGVGFMASGIVMFFAYNWTSLGKFSKIGLVELLIVVSVALALLTNLKEDIRKIFLTGASVLVGVLFAVFGQIYQTGANAYDLFLGWTLSITLWVFAAGFAPLWLLYLLLINSTVILYSQQVAIDWNSTFIYILIYAINLVALIIFIVLSGYRRFFVMPPWFIKTLALAAVACATIGIASGIYGNTGPAFLGLICLTTVSYSAGIIYSLKKRLSFYFSIIPFSIVIIISAFMLNMGSDAGMFLITFVFVIISVTLIIRNLISLQKKWAVE